MRHLSFRPAADGRPRPAPRGLVYLGIGLGLALASLLFILASSEWRTFVWADSMGHDLALFNQSFYFAVGHGWFYTTIAEQHISHGVLMANHFAPNFYLFLPFYAIWQSPFLLLFLASLAVGAVGLSIFLVAWQMFGSAAVAAVWFGLFALHPTVPWSIPQNGWREVFIAAGFLGFALFYYLKKDNWFFVLMLALAALSKEDVPLLLPVWGVVAWLQGRGRNLAAWLALGGVGYFLAVNAIAMPLLRGGHVGQMYFLGLTSPRGDTAGDILGTVLFRPGALARVVLSRAVLEYWASIFSPLLFLPLLGWEYLVIPAYVYAEISFSARLGAVPLPYIFPALPFIFAAAMVGTRRLAGFVERIPPLRSLRSAGIRIVSLVLILCALAAGTLRSTTLPGLLRWYWPADAALRRNAPLFQALAHVPPDASLAATDSLIAEGSSRGALYTLMSEAEYWPDYVAINPGDPGMDSPQGREWMTSVLCSGAYGVVHDDRVKSMRILLKRGAALAANRRVYEAVFPESRQACPATVQAGISPHFLAREARVAVRTVPVVVRPSDVLLGPVRRVGEDEWGQELDLPDVTFEPGWYRLELVGGWPWVGTSAADRLTMRVVVGAEPVGEVTVGGDQPLRYATPPFQVTRRETVPVRMRVTLAEQGPQETAVQVYHPTRGACAVVADAPSLNPSRQVTVEAQVELAEAPQRGVPLEAPILSKNDAEGYYLRLSGDAGGRTWVDFNVAGQWGRGQAGVGMVPVGRWTTITATYDGYAAKIYVDGYPVPQVRPERRPTHAEVMRSAGAPLVIGCRDPQRADAVAFPGRIAAVRVWDRVLTPEEIQEEAPLVGVVSAAGAPGLVGSWGFQMGRDGGISDLSGQGDAIVNGGALLRGPAPGVRPTVVAWRARELGLLRRVTVTAVPAAHVRTRFPSELGPEAMFPEPAAASGAGFAQVIHLPDYTLLPGWYRVALRGVPLPWIPAAYRLRAQVVVGGRTVGAVTTDGARPLRYTTAPFYVAQRETVPMAVRVEAWIPPGSAGQMRAFRPAQARCATVADTAALNPQRVTVEGMVYLDGVPPHPGTERELPIVSKNNAPGYYLRLISDAAGQLWADFSVAGKWALGRAGAGIIHAHRWTAIAATYDGREARLYVDGTPVPQAATRSPQFAGPVRSAGAPLVLGCRDPGTPYEVVFPGWIAAARVWNRALTAPEIRTAETMWPLPAGGTAGLVGHWGFQAGSAARHRRGGPPLGTGTGAPPGPRPFAPWRRLSTLLQHVTVRSVHH